MVGLLLIVMVMLPAMVDRRDTILQTVSPMLLPYLVYQDQGNPLLHMQSMVANMM